MGEESAESEMVMLIHLHFWFVGFFVVSFFVELLFSSAIGATRWLTSVSALKDTFQNVGIVIIDLIAIFGSFQIVPATCIMMSYIM